MSKSKLVTGVKSFKSTRVVLTPVLSTSTRYRTTNGREYDAAKLANKAQERINFRNASVRLSHFLTAQGLTPAGNPFAITTHNLAKALTDPKVRKALATLVG